MSLASARPENKGLPAKAAAENQHIQEETPAIDTVHSVARFGNSATAEGNSKLSSTTTAAAVGKASKAAIRTRFTPFRQSPGSG